ncbi:MAG TPA: phenylacetate-CoA oxygenase subunit PaaJ [Chitinophagaceae bacterium]|nr:phenylacetate-CoA oxygenase subunit PaaJ [Chitinophagaceae bacterium]HPH31596.1 phenylacetate-CoA oxygenase subunit PaaJ [Chitinophagaceae bacterium]HPN57935.1 phenylacetate-CoA oxygenase subunit PaaJ [Chitinophagaceae bacterium]
MTPDIQKTWSYLEEIKDPEIPVLSIVDLGIVREVAIDDEAVTVTITPTYTGCPAMDMIAASIKMELMARGFAEVLVKFVISPAWTTDWMTEKGKLQLKEYGIAPPNPRQQVCNDKLFAPDEAVQCPHCESWHTRRISEFGSTACKALYQCEDCKEPFDYFKCH